MDQRLRRLSGNTVTMLLAFPPTLAASGAAMRVEGGEEDGMVPHQADHILHTG